MSVKVTSQNIRDEILRLSMLAAELQKLPSQQVGPFLKSAKLSREVKAARRAEEPQKLEETQPNVF